MTRKKQIPLPTKFGKNLRKLRNAQGIGQAMLAHQLGLTRQKIASYEAGFVEPNAVVFLSVCTYFRVDPAQMLQEEIMPSPSRKSNSGQDQVDPESRHWKVASAMAKLKTVTDEFNRILEGYAVFRSTKPDQDKENVYAEEVDSFSILMEDLRNLMHMLSGTNREFLDKDRTNH